MTIDPKVAAWINIVVGIIGYLASATATLTPVFGKSTTETIVMFCGLIVGIWSTVNAGLHGVSSPKAGPLV
jgi:hypothetical protein